MRFTTSFFIITLLPLLFGCQKKLSNTTHVPLSVMERVYEEVNALQIWVGRCSQQS